MVGDKGAGGNDVKTWFRATLRNTLAGAVDFTSSHERACSAIRARASRARRLRCLRKIASSLATVFSRLCRAAYWCTAARRTAERLWRRDDVSVSLSRSFAVASSMAMVFMGRIITIVSAHAQVSSFDPTLANGNEETGRKTLYAIVGDKDDVCKINMLLSGNF